MIERIKLDGINIGPKIILSFCSCGVPSRRTGAVGYYSVGTVDEKAHLVADNAEKMDATSELTLGIEKQQEAILYAQLGQGKKQRNCLRKETNSSNLVLKHYNQKS